MKTQALLIPTFNFQILNPSSFPSIVPGVSEPLLGLQCRLGLVRVEAPPLSLTPALGGGLIRPLPDLSPLPDVHKHGAVS